MIVFAVTGIDTNINNGYIIDNLTDPKNRKSKFGSYAPNRIIGTDANNKIKGFFLPPNDLISSTIPIVAERNPSRAHFRNLCQEMIKQEVNVPWGCNMRCDKMDEEMCELAVKAKCEEFWMGLESGSAEIHRDINKGTTVDMIRQAFKVAKKFGIRRRTYALLGTPLESYETIKETEKLIDDVDPEIIGFSILAPYPGTSYWKSEYDELDWSQIDEFSNTTWHSNYLSNQQQNSLGSFFLTKIFSTQRRVKNFSNLENSYPISKIIP